jgi:hypothetical protein
MNFNPKGMATAIGSLPYKDPEAACAFVLDSLPDIPYWPQLPNCNFREQREIQFSEGIPCRVIDETKQRMYFDTSGDITSQLEQFYENFLAENTSYFKITPDFSRGIYEMKKQLSKKDLSRIKFIKSQVIGPITFGLSCVDEQKRAIYYNEIFRDVVAKAISMKARWILNEFKPYNLKQICFIDEPILTAFGSSTYVGVHRQDIIDCLKSVFDTIHQEDAIVGSHCCGNTEWTILIDAGVDIISFDAYQFGDTIGYYSERIKTFLENGGSLAWGIVPTSDKVMNESAKSLSDKLLHHIDNLSNKGIPKELILNKCLITPSCGTGSLSVTLSEKVFQLLGEINKLLI